MNKWSCLLFGVLLLAVVLVVGGSVMAEVFADCEANFDNASHVCYCTSPPCEITFVGEERRGYVLTNQLIEQ